MSHEPGDRDRYDPDDRGVPEYNSWIHDRIRDFGMEFYAGSRKFYDWTDATKDHWLLKLFIPPFTEPIGTALENATGAIFRFADRTDNLHNFIQDTLDEWLIDNLLVAIWGEWREFRKNPLWKVVDWIEDGTGLPREFWPRPFDYIRRAVTYALFPGMPVTNTWAEWYPIFVDYSMRQFSGTVGGLWWHIVFLLEKAWPEAWNLRVHPEETVYHWLVGEDTELDHLLTDPVVWARDKVADWLGFDADFFEAPWAWIMYAVKRRLDEKEDYYVRWIRSYGESMIRHFFEGVW